MNPLRQKIEQAIRERGPMPFSRYMELCLYDPEHGYYSRHAGQFGKAGDFYTSSDVHAVFGRLLARQFEEMWRVLGCPASIVLKELGAGRGLLAQDVLDWSEKKFPDFFHALRYVLVEGSPALRERMEETLRDRIKTGKAVLANDISGSTETGKDTTSVVPRGEEDRRASAPGVSQVVFANEFFDALPVEVLSSRGSLRIDSRNGRLAETWVPASAEEVEFLDRYSVRPEPGERVEAPLAGQRYAERVFAGLERGFSVFIDYGYTREEQLAGRHRGTLKAIRQHLVSGNPYETPGEQDITADVNFAALKAAAEGRGMQAQKLVTQCQFLMGIGEASQFADAFEDCRLPQERAKVALQLKRLVTPAGMGESFQVLVAGKGVGEERTAALAGLSFGRKAR
jgi:SAM-dependent MidA family methyltransferase